MQAMRLTKISRAVWGWAFYDFANSAFSTTVMSVVFSVYFANALVPAGGVSLLGHTIPGESLWGYLVSSVMIVVIFMAPGLGAWADHRAAKRAALALCTIIGGVATIALFVAEPGRLWFGVAAAFIAISAFELAIGLYNAFLNEISDEKDAGRVSGFGFAFGYIGGGVCLALNMAMIARPAWFGLAGGNATLPVRASVAVAGAWWLLFSVPTYFWVKDRPHAAADGVPSPKQLWLTIRDTLRDRDLSLFLLSYIVFNDGIQTILIMASIFGAKQLGMSTPQLALCYLMIQFVAFVGALVCGRLADSWSHKKVLLLTLMVYCGVTVWAVFMTRVVEFWMMGAIVGVVLGGSQAAARSLYSLMIPAGRTGEYFGLFSVVGKASSVFGPLVFGVTAQFFGLRAGVASLLLFFIGGAALLFAVNEASATAVESRAG
jgi:UMF1 family MFS transporter